MELSYEEVDKYLLTIFTGKEITSIKKGSNNIFIVFKQPSKDVKLRATAVYEAAYTKALDEGLYPMSDIEDLLYERGLFTEADEKQLSKLQSQLEAQQVLLSKTTKVKANSDRIKTTIDKIQTQMREIEFKKNSRLILSAETKADEEKHNYLCWACTYTDTNERYWETVEDLVLENDQPFRMNVMTGFLKFYRGIDMATIRYIARHNIWRTRYIHSQKTSEALFGIPTVDYSNDQLNLVYWSNYYTSIYEMMPEDRPSDSVIEDDSALDAYMLDYYNERSKEAAAARDKRVKGNMSAFEKEEVIVTQSNELYEDIKYDKPREAQKIKDKADIKKRTRRS